MHHFTAHELADAWELRAGLTDASAWDRAAAVAACLRECAAELRSAATPQPEAQPQWVSGAAESVASMVIEWVDGGFCMGTDWRHGLAGCIAKRLNRFAVPSAQAPQQPLTREQCIKLWGDRSDGPSNGEIVSFTRAIEAAHGITKDTK